MFCFFVGAVQRPCCPLLGAAQRLCCRVVLYWGLVDQNITIRPNGYTRYHGSRTRSFCFSSCFSYKSNNSINSTTVGTCSAGVLFVVVVMGGSIMRRFVRAHDRRLFEVDLTHAAIFVVVVFLTVTLRRVLG